MSKKRALINEIWSDEIICPRSDYQPNRLAGQRILKKEVKHHKNQFTGRLKHALRSV